MCAGRPVRAVRVQQGDQLGGGERCHLPRYQGGRAWTWHGDCKLCVQLILPTVCILLLTLAIMVTVIPYAFSSVIKQLQAVSALEDHSKAWPAPP